jgi:[protein-PII] uridylyltransferase
MRWTSDLGSRTSASGKAGDSLRGQLDELFAVLGERLRAPGSGAAACRAISDVYDQAMASRFAQAVTGVRAPLALVATGGWARRELAPFSDIDFVLLHDADEASAKQVADRLLYPLWDDKLAVGHALREARAAARLAKADLATATALLDARHIAGDRALTAALVRATLAQLAPAGNPNDFIAMLAAENKARHDRFGAAIYVLEPNLKMGIGALRDLSTALWAALVRWHPPKPDVDPPASETLIAELAALGI